jgi:predicted LPLAT superfamily acyltransferase
MGPIADEEINMKRKSQEKSNQNKSYGNKLGFSAFHFILKNIGLNCAYGILVFLVPYYVILRPSVYLRAKPYLQRRFPDDSFMKRYFRLFKYVFIFGQTLIDQFYFGFVGESKIKLEIDREPEILELLNNRPVIILMSHIGFWEVAMAGSTRFNRKLNVMVNKDFDKEKRQSFYDIQGNKFNLINVSDSYGGMIEATNALLRGEVVGVTGDRADQWRSKTVSFLGSPAKLPVIAQHLAVATGASVIVLLSSKEGKFKIRFRWKDISTEVLSEEKLNKDEKIQRMLELYSEELETHVQKHPYLWFNFFDFWKM